MNAATTRGTLLVTGATGYLAGWVIVELLKLRSRVQGSVRDTGHGEAARRSIVKRSERTDGLQFVRADLLSEEGWRTALDSVDTVLLAASPMPFDTGVELILSAREGTRRALTAAARAGVRRVVFTSSGTLARSSNPSDITTEDMCQSRPATLRTCIRILSTPSGSRVGAGLARRPATAWTPSINYRKSEWLDVAETGGEAVVMQLQQIARGGPCADDLEHVLQARRLGICPQRN